MFKSLVLALALTACALAKPVKVTLDVPGMTWGTCPQRVRGIITTVSGVSDVKTDQSKLQASFTYDDEKVKLDQVLDKLKSEWGGRYKASVAANK